LNELEENELKNSILKGYNESPDLKGFVDERVDGKGIKWSKKNKNEEWTKMTKKVFAEIGEKFKFKIEDTERSKEFMALDQVWFNKENDEAVLALETENSADFQVILRDEFRKLLNFKSDYKILIWYRLRKDEDEEKILEKFNKKVNGHSNTKNEVFFIIRLWQDGEVIGITISTLKYGKKRETSNYTIYNRSLNFTKVAKYDEDKKLWTK
jgi:hypothetical protein